MRKTRSLVLAFTAPSLLASCLLLAQQSPAPRHPMNFFVTSSPIGDGGQSRRSGRSRRALSDTRCRGWRGQSRLARLPQHAGSPRTAGHQCSRPHRHGSLVQRQRRNDRPDLAHLHGDTMELARLGNNLNKLTGLTEKGETVPGLYDYADVRDNDWDYVKTTQFSNRHEMLTGSQPDGRRIYG